MTKLKIGICGWGNVATGLYEQLVGGEEIRSESDIISLVAILDRQKD